jgi:hypothetical protein
LVSLLGALLGIASGVCFTGVAFTPADVYLEAHVQFVLWAFRLFPLAVLCFTLVMFRTAALPQRYAFVFMAFFALLVAYYLLLTQGPNLDSSDGLVLQALGQKIIVYASIISILIVSLGAWRTKIMH